MPAEGAMAKLGPRALDLYVLTSAHLSPRRGHEEIAAAAIEGGASAVQLRAPELDDDALIGLASSIAGRARSKGVLFVVNDRAEVAAASGADGVHVGQGDDPEGVRRRLPEPMVLGVSVGDVEEARAAEAVGADYVAVTVWATATKPEAVPVGIDGLREVVVAAALPVVAIGGIDAGNAGDVLGAGASGIAVIGAVAAAPDPIAAVKELRAVVDAFREER
jgi:thiamine-phosphate pyrophosphorylase